MFYKTKCTSSFFKVIMKSQICSKKTYFYYVNLRNVIQVKCSPLTLESALMLLVKKNIWGTQATGSMRTCAKFIISTSCNFFFSVFRSKRKEEMNYFGKKYFPCSHFRFQKKIRIINMSISYLSLSTLLNYNSFFN